MKTDMQRLFTLLITVLLMNSCVFDQDEKVEPYFANFPDFDALATQYQKQYPKIYKQVKSDSLTSQKTVDANWENELQLFKKTDINRINLISKYSIDTIESKLSGKTTYLFTPNSSKTAIKEARYTFDENGNWESVYFKKDVDNPVFETQQELWLTHNLNYRIVTKQKVNMVFNTNLVIEGEPVGAPREYMGMLNIEGEWFLRFKMYQTKNEKTEWYIQNGSETIELKSAQPVGDSSVLKFPVFNSEFRYKQIEDTLTGYWYNFDKGDNYRIEFFAAPYFQSRFEDELAFDSVPDVSGKWEVAFQDEEEAYPAIGIIEQQGTQLYGTFATETGDYRHLEGFISHSADGNGNTLYLNTLDGSHAFYFRATLKGDSLVNGVFASGKHYLANWKASKNSNAALKDPNALTFLKEGHEKLAFTFPNLKGEPVSLDDPQYNGKVVLVTLSGTWCPNCMDEAKYLKEVYSQYHRKGLEIIALQFERSEDFEKAKEAIERSNKDMAIPYTQLIAGKASGKVAAEKLPMLNHVMSFPTLIVLDKQGKVQRIHTGFYGPGTGDYYAKFVRETNALIEELL